MGGITIIIVAVAVHIPLIPFDYVMVSIHHIKPFLFVKSGQDPEDVIVNLRNGLQSPIFPQFITVSKFNIRKSFMEIIFQSAKTHILIGQKIISCVPLSSVTVAHDHQF